jgi:hypothetical protein
MMWNCYVGSTSTARTEGAAIATLLRPLASPSCIDLNLEITAMSSLSPHGGQRLTNLSLERFRTSTRYQDRPAAADIAFCVAAYANGMTENRIERALEDDYLSRDPSTSKRAAYIRRTMEKARRWAER